LIKFDLMRIRLLFALIFNIVAVNVKATHIVGGEMNYRYLGSNNYEIRLTVYRDCWVGVPPFDDPASMGVFDSNNNLLYDVKLDFVELDTLPPSISDPCTIPPTAFCYEVTTYIDTINLPPLAGGYTLSYQRCCRNQNILNIVSPLCMGATYWAHIPGPEVVAVNSNPVFNSWPPPFICADKPWIFDHSATDYDGDSLVYELFTPYTGLDYYCPIIANISPNGGSACGTPPSSCPNVPVNPPFSTIAWAAPYSTNDMLGGTPMAINPQTGLITAVPQLQGYFVIGVKVKEYRNGILISETLRDFQLIVLPCPSMVVAAATVPSLICGGSTVSFTNNSSGAGDYLWDFGDPSTTVDTSDLSSPSYTYPDTGLYQVNLIAFAPNTPACNDTTTTAVHIQEDFDAEFDFTSDDCMPSFVHFAGISPTHPNANVSWSWDLGDGSTSSAQSFTHEYQSSGSFQVLLVASVPGGLNCDDSIQAQTVTILKDGGLFIPNTFSPNADGKNDLFRVRGPKFPFYYLTVYNRWGEMVYESKDSTTGWDGTHKGMKADPGVYGYYLKAGCKFEDEYFIKGNLTLIR
jgi:gliding motility-associated-like protein